MGLPVAGWLTARAKAHGAAFMDEPNDPRLRRHEQQHTRDWARTRAQALRPVVSVLKLTPITEAVAA